MLISRLVCGSYQGGSSTRTPCPWIRQSRGSLGKKRVFPLLPHSPPLYVWDKPAGLPPKYPGDVIYQCTVLRVHLVYPEVREVRLSSEHDDCRWIEPTPEMLTPFGDYLPKETRDALEIFYQYYIFFPRLLRGEQL